MQQSIGISWPPGQQQQTRRAACGGRWDRRTDGRTDARQLHRPCPASDTILTVPRNRGARLQVEHRDGVVQPVLESGAGDLNWTRYMRPARDRHEQNVELVLDRRGVDAGRALRLRTSRDVRPGDQLLVWYGDQLAMDLGVPLLTPANFTGIFTVDFACT